jgi:redox-sensing transcriptional repressor
MGTDGTVSGREVVGSEPRLSRATVGRFSLYLRHLEVLLRDGLTKVSSGQLGDALGITDAQVRKDLACLGSLGHPGIGYVTDELIAAIRRLLGVDRTWLAALVGVGNLGRALLGYRGFEQRGFRLVALFDTDPGKVGQEFEGLTIHSTDSIPERLPETGAELAVVAVPSESAQAVADALVSAGVRGILNFAPVRLRVPSEVRLVSVDLTVQLEQLAFLVQTSGPDAPRGGIY